MKHTKRLILFLLAQILMTFGIALYLRAEIGVGPWDVLHNNLFEFYALSFGTWVFIVGIITILISQIFYKNIRNLLAIITGLIQGQFIDFWLDYVLNFELSALAIRIPIFLFSLVLLGSGISLLVHTKYPPTPPDILMLSIKQKFQLNYLKAKTLTELSAFLVAIIIGIINSNPFNNIGIGTLFTILFIGSIVEVSAKLWIKII
jgi:hypothetical protein